MIRATLDVLELSEGELWAEVGSTQTEIRVDPKSRTLARTRPVAPLPRPQSHANRSPARVKLGNAARADESADDLRPRSPRLKGCRREARRVVRREPDTSLRDPTPIATFRGQW